jgi:hypothetical protein
MSERTLERLVALCLGLYGFAISTALLLAGARFASAADLRAGLAKSAAIITYDDGFYYLQIAREVARGAGSTFDGVNSTNGYHPLWLLCLVPIYWVTSASDVALLLAVVLQAVLTAIGVGMTYRIARFDLGRFGAIAGAMLWVHAQLPYRTALSGMEYSLHAVTVLSVIYVCRSRFAQALPPTRAYVMLGVVLSLAFLARLDGLLLFGCIGPAMVLREREARGAAAIRRLLALSVPVVGVVLLYVGVNMWLFGDPLPVSGVIKRDWSARLLAQDPLYRSHGWLVAKAFNLFWPLGHMRPAYVVFLMAGSVGLATVWLMGVIVRMRRTSQPPRVTLFPRFPPWSGPVVLFGTMQLALYLVVYHDGYSFQRWYYVVQPWLGAMAMATAAERAWRWARRVHRPVRRARYPFAMIPMAAIVGVLIASLRTIGQWHDEALLGSSREPPYAAAQWVAANVPGGAIVGSWNAGMIGYLSGRRVINLDGRVNSWDFYRTKQFDLCRYWRESGITYLVDTFEMDHEVAFISAFYSPGVDLSSCADLLDRVWIGPAYRGTSEHAEAFTLR